MAAEKNSFSAIIEDSHFFGGARPPIKIISNDKLNCLLTYLLTRLVELFEPYFWARIGPTRKLGAALARARQVGVVDLIDACSDWTTVDLQFGQMSPTNVADVLFVSATNLTASLN